MNVEVEIRHEGLRRVRVVEGSDPTLVRRTASIQMATWERMWKESSACRESRTSDAGTGEVSGGPARAAALTREAQGALQELGAILLAPVSAQPKEGPEDSAFPEKPPESPPLPDPVPKPSMEQDRFQPRLGLIDWVVPGLRRKKKAEATRRFEQAWAIWHRDEERVRRSLSDYQTAFDSWDRRRLEFERRKRAVQNELRTSEDAYRGGVPAGVANHLRRLLRTDNRPACLPEEYTLKFDGASKHLEVHQRLLSPQDLPTLARVIFREEENDFLEEHLGLPTRNTTFDSVVFQSVLRTLKVLLNSDPSDHIQALTAYGWTRCVSPATGREEPMQLLQLRVEKTEFLSLDTTQLMAQACFDRLGGVRMGDPHELKPIQPSADPGSILQESNRAPGTDPIPKIRAEFRRSGLAEMPHAEFQQFMMRLLENEFSERGGEVRLAVAEADGSLEVIAREPDRWKGGIIIVHVKQAVAPLTVDAVDALRARVGAQHAAGGILITLGGFTPEAEEAAKGNRLTLLGGNVSERKAAPSQPTPSPGATFPSEGIDIPGLTTPQ